MQLQKPSTRRAPAAAAAAAGGRAFCCARPRPAARLAVRAAAVTGAPSLKEWQHTLPDGKRLEVISLPAAKAAGRPPLLFLHGSYHAAWCWKEHFMPYFSDAGYDTYAYSMRSQGGSERIQGASVAGTLDTHAADLASVVAAVAAEAGGQPVVIGHSFGGLILQKYVLGMAPPAAPSASTSSSSGTAGDAFALGTFPRLAGTGYLCSVPPSGNKQLVGRYFKKDWMLSLRLTWAFIAKSFVTNKDTCREMFFSPELPEQELLRLQVLLADCSPVRLLDLRDMNNQVPLPHPPSGAPPAFVLGASLDNVVDVPAVEELAAYCGVQPVVLQRLAHDVMLDARWPEAAGALKGWLDSLPGRT